jgi:PAS domain S-box-containing protein
LNWATLIHADDRERVLKTFKENNESKFIEADYRIITKSGKLKWINDKSYPLFDEVGEVERFVSIAEDITKRTLAEQALKKSEEEYSKLFHSIGEGVGKVDQNEVFIFCNDAAERIFGVPTGTLKGRSLNEFVTDEEWQRIAAESAKREAGESSKYELKIISANSKKKIIGVTASPNYDSTGKFVSTFGVFIDITARKLAEEKVQSLLKEKEILLREVHHRIKNNMTTIESLLRLHTRRTENEEVISSLMDAGNRIKSMRILYDKLLRSDNFSDISIFEYLSPLINEVMEVFPEKDEVQINKQIEDFEINAKLVFPLGIIINELFTNIMKYAFKDNVNNEVTIAASKRNGKALIVVQDNGIGISEEIDLKTTTSFGLKLVDMLIEQIDGSIEIVRENGTKFILEFDL